MLRPMSMLLSRLLVPLVVVALAGCTSSQPGRVATEASVGPSAEASPSETSAALPERAPSEGSAALCAAVYSPSAVAERSFAFDGTVVGIADGTTNKPGMGDLETVAVTFEVTEWFRGGSGPTVTVDMGRFGAAAVGDRLLVSGEPRWGGAPLEDAIAWGGGECGDFTRDYTESVAAEWRAAAS